MKRKVGNQQMREKMRQALDEYAKAQSAALPSDEEIDREIIFTPEHEARMQLLFQKANELSVERKRKKRMRHRLMQSFIAAMLVIVVFTAGVVVWAHYDTIASFFSGLFGNTDDGREYQKSDMAVEYPSAEALEEALGRQFLLPSLETERILYLEYEDKSLVEITLPEERYIRIYCSGAPYDREKIADEPAGMIQNYPYFIFESNYGVEAVIFADDIVYCITALNHSDLLKLLDTI